MTTQSTIHIPVLYQESLDALMIKSDGVYVDGTLGGAGHAFGIASQLSAQGMFIGCDVDYDAITRAEEKLHGLPCQKRFVHNNFRNLAHILDQLGITEIDGILLDLGWSSFQIADPERGLSFMHDGPLDMNLSKGLAGDRLTAYEIINYWDEATLADIFYGYGDEVKARVIARHIVQVRSEQEITTTHQLADEIIKAIYPKRTAQSKPIKFKIHPATKVFQALRIAVNDELEVITEGLHSAIQHLAPQGRLAVITFHSGEDRIVKHLFKSYADTDVISLVHKKPLAPTRDEILSNSRARSAKLRIVEKL
jgi:16S rRNA (cytosine1402-N4)-methyltransferase